MFRLPYQLFTSLVHLVCDDIHQKPIPEPLSHIPGRIWTAEKKLGLAIMLLSSGNSQHHVANCFDCGRSTVSKFLHQFVVVLIKNLGRKLRWPETAGELAQVKDGFRALLGLPNCCGAIDATHINMNLPKNETNKSWFDRKGNYSMLVQGIVDANKRFLDVNIGWLGCCNDKHVLRNSGFYRLCQGRERLAGPTSIHEDVSIQEYIVGDGGYVLLSWLVIPYPRAMFQSTSHCRVHTDLEDKAKTFTQALVNEAAVSYLGDLENKNDNENDEDDDDKEDEDPTSTSRHQGPDDDDNDDVDLSGIGPSEGTSTGPPPADPPTSTGTDVDHSHDIGATGGSQDSTAILTYTKHSGTIISSTSKKMATSTMVSSTGKEKAISTMVPSTGQ
ncbi:hypothetical protein L7F22_054745 [Adiantum nelumboides]|nr:hypothetical protein [Adiantum nelumboides]